MWTPEPAALQHVLTLLKNAGSSDTEVQRQLTEAMAEFKRHPLCCHYLAYVATYEEQQTVQVRAFAAVILKQTLIELVRANQHGAIDLSYVKECAKASLRSEQPMIRQSISIVVTTIVSSQGIASWPDAIPFLLAGLEVPNEPAFVDGCIRCLEKIAEDVPHAIEEHRDIMQSFIDKMIRHLQSPSADLRRLAAHALYQFLCAESLILQLVFETYLGALLAIAQDNDARVRRLICQTLVRMLEGNADKLAPHFHNLVQYMLLRLKDEDDQVALESCEFWLQVPEVPDMTDELMNHLPTVIPALMDRLVYSEEELLLLEEDEEEETVPDRAEDIAPRHHASKAKKSVQLQKDEGDGSKKEKKQGNASKTADGAEKEEEEEEEEDEDEEDEDQNEDDAGEWTIRKCAAASIDLMAVVYGPEILPIILPLIEQRFASTEWTQKECGILALGAIAEGCIDGITGFLPGLVPYLLTTFKDDKTLIRAITAWTLSRFRSWICNPDDEHFNHELYQAVMQAYLQGLRDPKKKVQESSISAFSDFMEESMTLLIPFLPPILETFRDAFAHYQHKNILGLFDAITALGDAVGPALNEPQYLHLLMPPMFQKWDAIGEDSTDLYPLFNAFTSVATALGEQFTPFAPEVRARCTRMITTHIQQHQQRQASQPAKTTMLIEDAGHLVSALDMLGSLVESLGPASADFIAQCQPPIVEMMIQCAQYPNTDVKQSAFALLGDLASHHFDRVEPYLANMIMSLVVDHMQVTESTIPMCNNAVWSAGEIALKWGPQLRPYVPALLDRLIPILNRPLGYAAKTLFENAAITLGRIAMHNNDLAAPRLGEFLDTWLRAMGRTSDNEEKADAFRGFCAMVLANPAVVTKCFLPFVDAICYWQNAPQDLHELFHRILHAYQQMYGEKWPMVIGAFPPNLRQRLSRYYAL